MHPHFLHIVTSGIEKDILLHSPAANSPCSRDMERTSTDVRVLSDDEDDLDRSIYFRALAGFPPPEMDNEEGSERITIQMFDQ
jgi:WD repeat-containing protein 22